MTPTTLIIRTAGTNCDRELAHAFELAGSTTMTVHLNRLIDEPEILERANVIGFPGGFSYGDDIAAGRIFANRLRHRLLEPLRDAVRRGVPMIGICNGFQVLVKLGLLPDPVVAQPTSPVRQAVTLSDNACGRFIDRWVALRVDPATRCIWTRGLDRLELPIAHAAGRFVAESEQLMERLRHHGQVVLRYVVSTRQPTQRGAPIGPNTSAKDVRPVKSDQTEADPTHAFAGNPNGSMDGVAGICDPSGLVLGLMPHPERYTHPTHHPWWSRGLDGGNGAATVHPLGLRMFMGAVAHVKNMGGSPNHCQSS